ncbi:MAG TPA: hypothetical protein DD435_14895 [Cyanobacteria bacterium UBA8530]|nr:hypothetical protein [Cyanobacteria bacterium UBA8530]
MKSFIGFQVGRAYVTQDGRHKRCLATDRICGLSENPVVLLDLESGAVTITSLNGGAAWDKTRVVGEEEGVVAV